MKGFVIFALIVAALFVVDAQDTNGEEKPLRNFDEVRSCLSDLSRINEDNNKGEDILVEALYENLYRALECVEVLSDLENMELTADQEKELQDWQEEMEAKAGNEEDRK